MTTATYSVIVDMTRVCGGVVYGRTSCFRRVRCHSAEYAMQVAEKDAVSGSAYLGWNASSKVVGVE